MSHKLIFTLTIITAIILVTNAIIAFNANHPLKWLWLVVALFSVVNIFLVYKRKQKLRNVSDT